jgi:TIR domain
VGRHKLNVFISYSHDDDPRWLERVQKHLKPLARVGALDLWDDTRIKSGDRWRPEIRDALVGAEVAVLLISANFYASEFIDTNELPPLLEAAREGGLVILGVHINPSRFDRDQILSEYQTVNPPDQPITSLSEADQEKVFDDLARRIEELAEPTGWSESSTEPRARLGRLYGAIPNLPPKYLERARDLDAIKAKLLGADGASVAVVGARRALRSREWAGSARPCSRRRSSKIERSAPGSATGSCGSHWVRRPKCWPSSRGC